MLDRKSRKLDKSVATKRWFSRHEIIKCKSYPATMRASKTPYFKVSDVFHELVCKKRILRTKNCDNVPNKHVGGKFFDNLINMLLLIRLCWMGKCLQNK